MIEPKRRYQSSRLTSAETHISRSAAHWDRAADPSLMENSSLHEPSAEATFAKMSTRRSRGVLGWLVHGIVSQEGSDRGVGFRATTLAKIYAHQVRVALEDEHGHSRRGTESQRRNNEPPRQRTRLVSVRASGRLGLRCATASSSPEPADYHPRAHPPNRSETATVSHVP
jgi:hypothetical protein